MSIVLDHSSPTRMDIMTMIGYGFTLQDYLEHRDTEDQLIEEKNLLDAEKESELDIILKEVKEYETKSTS